MYMYKGKTVKRVRAIIHCCLLLFELQYYKKVYSIITVMTTNGKLYLFKRDMSDITHA